MAYYVTKEFDDEVVRLFQGGGVGFIPTDTIYGLSCLALNQSSVEKIHRIKGRDYGKPFIVLISDLTMLDLLSIDKTEADAISNYWPGPLSVIFQSTRIASWLQLGTNSLAVRFPDHTGLQKLINQVGPIVSTSANYQNQSPIDSVLEAKDVFGDRLDLYVDGGLMHNQPSTVAKLNDGHLEVIRQGAVKI